MRPRSLRENGLGNGAGRCEVMGASGKWFVVRRNGYEYFRESGLGHAVGNVSLGESGFGSVAGWCEVKGGCGKVV